MTQVSIEHDLETVERPPQSAPLTARSLSVVIPIYNEQEILRHTVATVLDGVRPLDLRFFEILLCENGSQDDTLEIARRLEAELAEVRVIVLEEADYGKAMRAGFLASRGEAVVNFDADYYDLDFLTAALKVDGDVVVAAKGLAGSDDARVLTRRIVSRSFGWLVRHILNVKVTETHGMKLWHRPVIAPLVLQVGSSKDIFDTELIARAEWSGLAIRELPIRTEELRHSRSGILRRIPRTMLGLVQMRYRLRAIHALRVRPELGRVSNSESSRIAA
jgi:glycosyltransferase involved in cell wall biosynthesis